MPSAAALLELQAKELLESFDERRREAKLRRRAQAAQVFVSLEHDPLEDTAHANVLNMSAGLATGLEFGLGLGLGIGFAISINRTEWPSYLLTRWRLALHHQLP